jgi:flagellar biosynthesis protein FlhA
VELFAGDVPSNAILVEISSSQAEALGLRVIREEEHPVSGHRVFWTESSPAILKMLGAGSISHYDFFDFITLRMCQFCIRHPEEFISVTYVHSLLRQIEKKYPGLMGDGFGREFVSIPKLTEILQELVRQGISIRDFRSIIEGLASYCAASGITIDSNTPVEVADAVHFIRASRRRQIVRRFVGSIPVLPVITLSPRVERDFEDVQAERWTTALAMPPEQYDSLFQGLHSLLRPAFNAGILPIALLCSKEIKEKVISFVRATGLNLFVTTLDEIDPAFPVMQVGIWKVR